MGVVSQHHQLLLGNKFEECHAVGSDMIGLLLVVQKAIFNLTALAVLA